jgi:outer membrane receptor for ferrienterochelin and colicins
MKKNAKFVIFILIVLFQFMGIYGNQETVSNDSNKKIILEGFVLDEDGSGIFAADVIVPQKGVSVKTSKSGRFVIELNTGGTVHLDVYKSGYLGASTKSFVVDGTIALKPLNITLVESPMEEVVVTGTSTPKLYSETPVKTSVASRKDIEKKGAVCLADSLEIMTGVRVEDNCQNCNFTQVRINGMEGKYSQILINGMPVVSALAGVYALEQIPANMIEKLEVVKGGGSALYGGNAVAGVVNVITKENEASGTRISLNQESINKSSNTVLNFNTDYTSKNHATHASFFTNYQNRDHMDYNDDGFSDLGELTNLSLGGTFVHNFDAVNGKLKLNFTSLFEDRRGGNKFDLPEHFADIAESIRTYRTDVGVGWEQTFGSHSLLRFDGSFSYTKRRPITAPNKTLTLMVIPIIPYSTAG